MVGILGVADLANNIASATKGLATAFGLASPDPTFTQFADQGIEANFQREHWYKNPSQGLYSFSVKDVGKETISEYPAFVENIASLFGGISESLGGAGKSAFGEFKLPITPQEITQTEDFAVSIKPTQGGTVVNHSGNKYKTLSISGTTGVQPNRGLLGAYKGTGLAIGKPDELKYRSGYEVFQHFRQWMRAYHEVKSRPGSEKLRMMFRNYKDWEFLYVEPIKFTMKRDASKPLLYNYSIQFRVLGTFKLKKPLFDLAVGKLNEVSVAVANTYVLIKKNKTVTETLTGTISDFEQSINNLKYAIKAANREDVKLSEFTKSDANKLSYRETLQVLGALGTAMGQAGSDPKGAEASGSAPNAANPVKKASDLSFKAANPQYIDSFTAKAELNSLLDTEPGLLTQVPLDSLPSSVLQIMTDKQREAASISRIKVKAVQDQAQALSNKLAEGIGLGDSTYNRIFGLTSTSGTTTTEVTDAQFEMLYALSQTRAAIDGLLSSDTMFDTNARLFSKADATNGSESIGAGIFALPDPSAGIKEGYVAYGQTLEDIALAELGDTARWTEIAELNGLKSPYIIDRVDALAPNFEVSGDNFTNPTQIRDLQIGQFYLIPSLPLPSGAWIGKGDQIAEYQGGDATLASSWRFIFPDEGTAIKVIQTQQYFTYNNSIWTETDPNTFNMDGVLKPGDKIKIPGAARAPINTPIKGPRDNPYTNGLDNAEKTLGVDLKLTEDLDLDLTPAGDLNVAIGTENAAQAIVLKLLYKKGSLKKFTEIGTNLTPGKKLPDIATLRADITASLLIDSRIENVTKINLIQENSAVTLSFDVIFKDVQQPIPINIPI